MLNKDFVTEMGEFLINGNLNYDTQLFGAVGLEEFPHL